MNNNTTAPTYTLRGLQLIGWRDMQHALDYLFADGQLKQGTLVAINAEKMLTIEDNAEVRELINAAEFKYADGISVVRSVRKKYPQAAADFYLLTTSKCACIMSLAGRPCASKSAIALRYGGRWRK